MCDFMDRLQELRYVTYLILSFSFEHTEVMLHDCNFSFKKVDLVTFGHDSKNNKIYRTSLIIIDILITVRECY